MEKLKFKIKKSYIIVLVILLFVLVPVGLYFYSPLSRLTAPVFKRLPYPIALVEGKIITSAAMIADADAVKNFYQSQDFSKVGMRVDFTTEEGKLRLRVKEKDVFDKLIENQIIKSIANKRNIKVTKQEADNELQRKINEAGDRRALELNLENLYGWDLDEFRDKVVINQIYLKKLAEHFFKQEKQAQEGYKKITQAKAELNEKGSNFAQVAQKYSEGQSAQNGGDLGWFRYEQLVPEVAKEIMNAPKGKVTDIIHSSLGYHIVLVEDKREVQPDENQTSEKNVISNQEEKMVEVKLKQIFVKNGGFLQWLAEEKKNANVLIFMNEYHWDKEKSQLKFSDQSLNSAEKRIRENAEGDPSMLQ